MGKLWKLIIDFASRSYFGGNLWLLISQTYNLENSSQSGLPQLLLVMKNMRCKRLFWRRNKLAVADPKGGQSGPWPPPQFYTPLYT
jgi:hypothetical protein